LSLLISISRRDCHGVRERFTGDDRSLGRSAFLFHNVVALSIVLAVALTALSMLRFVRAARSPHWRRASA
jgi:hypothetical protein